jgi:hypothetical protein
MITRRCAIGMAVTAAFAPCLARRTPAQTSSIRDPSAQNWPTRFVRLIVPFPPGGGTDAIARVVAGKLSDMWGQQMVVENRGGAATNIGTEAVVRAEADGYTMLLQSMPLAVNRFLFPSLSYDAISDLAPVSLLCEYANIMAVPVTSPAHSSPNSSPMRKPIRARSPSPPRVTAPRCISPANCSSAWPASKCCTCHIGEQGLRSTISCPAAST